MLCAQSGLSVTEKYAVYLVDVVDLVLYAVFHYEVEGAAVRKRKPRLKEQIPCLVQVQLQRHGQRQGSLSGGVVVNVPAYLGEVLAVYIGLLVDLRIRKTLAVYYPEQILLEGLVLLLYYVVYAL